MFVTSGGMYVTTQLMRNRSSKHTRNQYCHICQLIQEMNIQIRFLQSNLYGQAILSFLSIQPSLYIFPKGTNKPTCYSLSVLSTSVRSEEFYLLLNIHPIQMINPGSLMQLLRMQIHSSNVETQHRFPQTVDIKVLHLSVAVLWST